MFRIKRWVFFSLSLALSFAAGSLCILRMQPALQPEVVAVHDCTKSDTPTAFRQDRQDLRQAQISQLNEIIHGAESESEIVALAQRRLLEIMENSEREMNIENILNMRGFADSIAVVHADSASIFLSGENLTEQQAAMILECVVQETEISSRNVKIIPIN